jgi:NAD(P)-dependent dehydrogenase (short-subunit alcohol dehydrogenase family)
MLKPAVGGTAAELGGLDCVVNNGGATGRLEPYHRLDPERFTESQVVNVTGRSTP